MKKSVCLNYAIMLLLVIVRHSENTDMFERYGQRLVAICDQGMYHLVFIFGVDFSGIY